MTRLALFSALSDRAAEGRLCLVDSWSFDVPKTKDAVRALDALGLEGSILIVIGPDDGIAERSFANLRDVDLVDATQLTAYDVLVNDWIVFTDATLPGEATPVADSPTAIAAKEAAASATPEEDDSSVSAAGEDSSDEDDSSSDAEESADVAEADVDEEEVDVPSPIEDSADESADDSESDSDDDDSDDEEDAK